MGQEWQENRLVVEGQQEETLGKDEILVDGQFTRHTTSDRFDDYSVSLGARTTVNKEQFTHSTSTGLNSDKQVLISMANDKTGAAWSELRDQPGRILTAANASNGQVTVNNFEGVIGKVLNLATSSHATSGKKLIDESWLVNLNKTAITDINGFNIARIGEVISNGRIRNQGIKHYIDGSGHNVDYQVVQTTSGHVLIYETGYVNAQHEFVATHKVYSFFDMKHLGTYDLADWTVSTHIINGVEIIDSYSDDTDINNGLIRTGAKRGVLAELNDVLNTKPENDRYDFIAGHIKANKNIQMKFISSANEGRINNQGQLMITIDEPTDLNDEGLPVRGSGRLITFFHYRPSGETRVANGAMSYDYVKGHEDAGFYSDKPVVINNTNGRFEDAVDTDGNIVPVVVFDTHDIRMAKQSIAGRAVRLDNGNIFAEYHVSAKTGKGK
jgi:hypothetical protein